MHISIIMVMKNQCSTVIDCTLVYLQVHVTDLVVKALSKFIVQKEVLIFEGHAFIYYSVVLYLRTSNLINCYATNIHIRYFLSWK